MTKDFTAWARPGLVLKIDGREYTSRPPVFGEIDLLLAIAVRVELQVGLAQGEMPDDLAELLDKHGDRTVAEVSLGADTLADMRADRVPEETITRMGLYAALYWARGEAQADVVAELAWGQGQDEQVVDEAPKDPRRSKSGPSTASVSPTSSASTPTTASPATASRRPRARSKKTTGTA